MLYVLLPVSVRVRPAIGLPSLSFKNFPSLLTLTVTCTSWASSLDSSGSVPSLKRAFSSSDRFSESVKPSFSISSIFSSSTKSVFSSSSTLAAFSVSAKSLSAEISVPLIHPSANTSTGICRTNKKTSSQLANFFHSPIFFIYFRLLPF